MAASKHINEVEATILKSAKKVFQTKGMEGARMQEIADEAGINKAMLHYYFRNKQQLFEAVFRQSFSLLAVQVNKTLNADISLEEKIRHFTSGYISFIVEHPYLPNFIIQELNRSPEFVKKYGEFFPDIEKFRKQLADLYPAEIQAKFRIENIVINLLSLNIFPFLAKPLIKGFLHLPEKEFQQLMEQRKTAVADFIIHSIKYPS